MNENVNAGSGPLHADFGSWSTAKWALLVVALSVCYVAIGAPLGRHTARPQAAALVTPEAVVAESYAVASLSSEEDGCGCAEACLVMNPTAPSKALRHVARHAARTLPAVGLMASR